MKRSLASLAALAALCVGGNLACIGVSAAAETATTHGDHHATHGSMTGMAISQFVRENDIGMAKMMADMHAPGYSGNPDIDFLAMMIPHHQGAVEMARLVLIHGRDPVTRKLAEEIIASQQVEIEGMMRRVGQLRRGDNAEQPDGFPALGGTRNPERRP